MAAGTRGVAGQQHGWAGVLAWLRAGARAELEQHSCVLLGDHLPGESMGSSLPPGPGANAQELQ